IHPPLDQKLADKILNGEYVDFASIIHRDHLGETMTIKKTNNSTVTSIQKASAKRITEIDQWNKAFQIYADIYSAKYHSQAPQLFRYMSIIQNLSHNSQQWIAYDEKFRLPFVAPQSSILGHTQTKSLHTSYTRKVTVGSFKNQEPATNSNAQFLTNVATVRGPTVPVDAQSHSMHQRDPHTQQFMVKDPINFQNKSTCQHISLIKETDFPLPTPVLIHKFIDYIHGYDTDKTQFLAKGFSEGFPLGTEGILSPHTAQNHSSVHTHFTFVQNKLSKEVTRGRIKGPYNTPPLKIFVCSPLGAVPKRTPNCFRLIHDLSFSPSATLPAVNSLIPKQNSATFLNFAKDIGLPIKDSKTVHPNTSAELHGILVDTTSLTAKLPADKVSLLRDLLKSFKHRKKVTLKELQSLLGHLNFACKVIKPGRCFLRRLYDLTIGVIKPHHHIRMTSETRADLALWHAYLDNYNGCTLLTVEQFIPSTTLKLFSDAAGSKGFACTHGSSWTFGIFPEKVKHHHINILELYPIALAVTIFGHLWRNKNILFICDNMAVVYCLNKQTSKDKIMMKLIRAIVLTALENNFCFHSKHISTKNNTICDLLSRLQVSKALTLAPHLNKTPLPIPLNMSPHKLMQVNNSC
ncbi:hypothetical protein MAR_033079, partial [Mya arenaria]